MSYISTSYYLTVYNIIYGSAPGRAGRRRALVRGSEPRGLGREASPTPNLPTEILDFTGFDSSGVLILRCGILMSIGYFPEMVSQQILVGVILVGGLGLTLRSGISRLPRRQAQPHVGAGHVAARGRVDRQQHALLVARAQL